MPEIALCDNQRCENYGHITRVISKYIGSVRDEARGCPMWIKEYAQVSECCGSEDIIEKNYEDLTDEELKELEEMEEKNAR